MACYSSWMRWMQSTIASGVACHCFACKLYLLASGRSQSRFTLVDTGDGGPKRIIEQAPSAGSSFRDFPYPLIRSLAKIHTEDIRANLSIRIPELRFVQ